MRTTGLGWPVTILVIQAILKLYNVVYAVWIMRLKGYNKSARCQFKFNLVVYGALCVAIMEMLRLLSFSDPNYYIDAVPDRFTSTITELSNALVMVCLCVLYVSFNRTVQSQCASGKKPSRNWAKNTVIGLAAVGAGATIIKDYVVLIVNLAAGNSYESLVYLVFNAISVVSMASLFIFLTVEVRTFYNTLTMFSETFNDRASQAQTIHRIDELQSLINRYFYPAIACGFLTLLIVLLYSFCTADLSAASYILSWTFIHFAQSVTTLLMLFILEGKAVPTFSCRSCVPDCKKNYDKSTQDDGA